MKSGQCHLSLAPLLGGAINCCFLLFSPCPTYPQASFKNLWYKKLMYWKIRTFLEAKPRIVCLKFFVAFVQWYWVHQLLNAREAIGKLFLYIFSCLFWESTAGKERSFLCLVFIFYFWKDGDENAEIFRNWITRQLVQ